MGRPGRLRVLGAACHFSIPQSRENCSTGDRRAGYSPHRYLGSPPLPRSCSSCTDCAQHRVLKHHIQQKLHRTKHPQGEASSVPQWLLACEPAVTATRMWLGDTCPHVLGACPHVSASAQNVCCPVGLITTAPGTLAAELWKCPFPEDSLSSPGQMELLGFKCLCVCCRQVQPVPLPCSRGSAGPAPLCSVYSNLCGFERLLKLYEVNTTENGFVLPT